MGTVPIMTGSGTVPYDIDPDCPDRDDYPLMERFRVTLSKDCPFK